MNWKMSAEFAQPFQIRRVHRNSPHCECTMHRLEPWVFALSSRWRVGKR